MYLGSGLNSTHCHKFAVHNGELGSGRRAYLLAQDENSLSCLGPLPSTQGWPFHGAHGHLHPMVLWTPIPQPSGRHLEQKRYPAALKGDLAALHLGKLQTWKFSARKTYLTKAQTRHLAPTLCDAGLPDWQENHSKELIMLLEQIPRAVLGYFYFIIRYNMFCDAPYPGQFLKIVFAYSLIPVYHQLSKNWTN